MHKCLFTMALISMFLCSDDRLVVVVTGTQWWRPAETAGWRERGVRLWPHRHRRGFWRSGVFKGEL